MGGSGSVLNDGNPLVSSVSDPAGTITSTVDLLGRVVSYSDVWGQTTTYGYDQAGRRTLSDGPAGRRDFTFDDAGQLEDEALADPGATGPGLSASNPTYPNGEMTSAVMGNSSNLAVGYDVVGRTDSLAWTGLLGSAIATDDVERSQTGRVVDETIDGTDANPGTGAAFQNFKYDGNGRLTSAWVPGQALTYGTGPTPPAAPSAPPPPARTATGPRCRSTRSPPPTATTPPAAWCRAPMPPSAAPPTTPGATPPSSAPSSCSTTAPTATPRPGSRPGDCPLHP